MYNLTVIFFQNCLGYNFIENYAFFYKTLLFKAVNVFCLKLLNFYGVSFCQRAIDDNTGISGHLKGRILHFDFNIQVDACGSV